MKTDVDSYELIKTIEKLLSDQRKNVHFIDAGTLKDILEVLKSQDAEIHNLRVKLRMVGYSDII